MVTAEFDPSFQKTFSKIKDPLVKEKIIKQVAKLKENPELGKPMRYTRKGTRELYISQFGLSYLYVKGEDKIVILDLYHKNEQ
ncbi:type II toxin-antitoxin system RelE/ParE family toxin [Candidatus Woesearchaeota archaeon]|nr:type II toxin-antitoxin system RelE/ParE family toxin [Candidatus Woesearchaeota archaeon]